MSVNYDYPALKAATAELAGEIENFTNLSKAAQQAGAELVAGNNAPGITKTMGQFDTKQDAIIKVMNATLENMEAILENARAIHVANGGEA